jgi:VanZ family protein
VEHFTAYALLAALPALERFRCRNLRTVLIFLFLLGVALEVVQLFSPGRVCDWHDALANSLGILAGAGLIRGGALVARRLSGPVAVPPASRP